MTTANTAFISFVCLLLVSIKCKSFYYSTFPPSDGNGLLLLTFQGLRYSLWEIKARTHTGTWSRNPGETHVFRFFLYIYLHPSDPNPFSLLLLSSCFYFNVTCILPFCLLTLKISFSTLMVHFQLSWAILSIYTFFCNLHLLIYT